MSENDTYDSGSWRDGIRTEGEWTRQGPRWRYVLTLSGDVPTEGDDAE